MSCGAVTFAYGGDKEWIAIDGRAGLGDGHVYTAWQVISPYFPDQFTRSIDGGVSSSLPFRSLDAHLRNRLSTRTAPCT